MKETVDPRALLLTDYEPVSVFKLEEHHPHRAKFRAIDMHAHPEFAETTDEIKAWSDRLEENNIKRVVIHTYTFGDQFEEIYDKFKSVSDKFEMWCGPGGGKKTLRIAGFQGIRDRNLPSGLTELCQKPEIWEIFTIFPEYLLKYDNQKQSTLAPGAGWRRK